MQELQEPVQAIDWPMIQALYLQGLGPTAIAKKTGVKVNTISVMATRKGWAKSLQKAGEHRKVVEISVQQSQDDSPKLTAQSEAVRAALARDLKRVCDLLETKTPSTIPAALKRQQDMESLVRNAKTVFGWSDSNTQPSVRINVMSNCTLTPPPAIEQSQGKVIDVTPVPPQEQS